MITVRAWLTEHDILPPLTKVTAHHELRQKQGESREKKNQQVYFVCAHTHKHTHIHPLTSNLPKVKLTECLPNREVM